MRSEPPVAPQHPTERRHHGDVFVERYEWLRDKDSPEVRAHLDAENAFTDAETAHLGVLQEQLFEEIRSRTQETDMGVPVREGDWWHYARTEAGKQYSIRCRVPVASPDEWTPPVLPETGAMPGEQVLFDANVEAEGHEFYSLGGWDVSPDGTLLVYAEDVEGDERYVLRIRDLATGENLPDTVEDTAGGAFFEPGGRFVFYLTVDDAWRPDTVWRHELGTPVTDDVVVFREPDEKFWVGAGLTRSRRYLVIEAGSKVTSETLLLDTADPTGAFTSVWPRTEGVEYEVEHAVIGGADRLLVLHNDGALDFELVDVAADDPTGERRVVVPHRPGLRLDGVDAFAGHLVLEYRRDVLPRIAVALLDGVADATALDWRELDFDEELYAAHAGGNPEWAQPVLRFGFTSFVTPSSVYDLEVATHARRLLKQQAVLGGVDLTRYAQAREWATAEDGTRVPISLVYRADLVTPGEAAPLHLYGYGSYEHSIDPGFSIPRLSLLDRGVVFAVAHVRGGGELGRAWYDQGKTTAKRTTFTDFVACARHLADTGWTTPDRLVAEGGSAGGLLMGAVANIAPEAFAGILAAVPFVDALTSMLDPELPLTVTEWDEWGDPLHDPEAYALMKSYSPYENVREVGYPRILAVTSINDTRVLYVEPAKWVARLREVGAPVLLRTEMAAGHGGVSGRYESWRKRAFELAWLLDVLGLSGAAR